MKIKQPYQPRKPKVSQREKRKREQELAQAEQVFKVCEVGTILASGFGLALVILYVAMQAV